MSYLQSFPSVDVHDFGDILSGGMVTPRSVESKTAIAMFEDQSRGPINMLNLGGCKPNPVPSCMSGLQHYDILEHTRGSSGKLEQHIISDLTDSTKFQLCGKKGAYSMPHIDRHGVLTTVFDDDGLKLWPFWPASGLKSWAESGTIPTEPGIGLFLYPGCTLIQPRGTIHAPLSISNVLMSGTMHWDSRNMLDVLQLSLLEKESPHITNEDTAKEFLSKVQIIDELWRKECPAWTWGPSEDYERYSVLVEVSHDCLWNKRRN